MSTRGSKIDRLIGLEMGADDYMLKSFSPRELVAQIRVVLRRLDHAVGSAGQRAPEARGATALGGFELNQIGYAGQTLQMTRYAYLLLMGRTGGILSRNQLMDSIWHDAQESNDRTVDTHIKILCIQLKAVAPAADLSRTHRGLGYSVEPVIGDKSKTS